MPNNEIFDDDKSFRLWAYNIESVLAEKVETIFRRTVFNTRPGDFYDVYILASTQKLDKSIFKKALRATAEHRSTAELISDADQILKNISGSKELRAMWDKYRKQFSYAEEITCESVLIELQKLTQ